jgi:phage terminase small subunit
MPELTAKQSKFVAEYLVDGNGARAAVAAGYGRAGAKVTAHRLTHANRAVQAQIQARQAQDSQRLQIERQDVIAGLLGAIEQARAQANPGAMIAGWREVGRMLGFYEPQRHQVEVSAAAEAEMVRYERMTDAELVRLVAAPG